MKFDYYYAYRNDVFLILFNYKNYFTLFVVIWLKSVLTSFEICCRYLQRELVAKGVILEQNLPQ
jgi:hypothetical protein